MRSYEESVNLTKSIAYRAKNLLKLDNIYKWLRHLEPKTHVGTIFGEADNILAKFVADFIEFDNIFLWTVVNPEGEIYLAVSEAEYGTLRLVSLSKDIVEFLKHLISIVPDGWNITAQDALKAILCVK
ncbi:MAG: hypothetical protein QXY15_04510 [Candidatus Nitrosotenuis sp.]